MLKYTLATRQYVVVPISNDSKAARYKVFVAARIASALIVLSTVGFDNEAKFETYKVDNPCPDWHLPTKLDISQTTRPEQVPESLLGSSGSTAQGLRKSPLLS